MSIPTTPADTRAAAIAHARAGYPIVAVKGKAPVLPGWQKGIVPSPETVEGWFAEDPHRGFGLVLTGNGIAALDKDGLGGKELFDRIVAKLTARFPHIPEFPASSIITSGGDGETVIFFYNPKEVTLENLKINLPGEHQGLELFARTKQIVMPPSPHPSGRHYRTVKEFPSIIVPTEYLVAFVETMGEERAAVEGAPKLNGAAHHDELFPGMRAQLAASPFLQKLAGASVNKVVNVVPPVESYTQLRERLRRTLVFIADHGAAKWLINRGDPGNEGWITIVLALKSLLRKGSDWPEEEVWSLLDEFSRKAPRGSYNEAVNRRDFNSAKADGELHEHTIFKIAQDIALAKLLPDPTVRQLSDVPALEPAAPSPAAAQEAKAPDLQAYLRGINPPRRQSKRPLPHHQNRLVDPPKFTSCRTKSTRPGMNARRH